MASSAAAAVSTSFLLTNSVSINKMDHSILKIKPSTLSLKRKMQLSSTRKPLIVQATYRNYNDGGRSSTAGVFVGGFILGGLIVGTLGCVYAPQISNAIAGTDKKELLRKLPKFIYDEEKALEKTRKVLANKIEELNTAIDEIASQLHLDLEDTSEVVVVNSDEVEAAT